VTRIIRPITAHYFNPSTSTLNQSRPFDPQAVKQLQAILDAPEDTAEASHSSQKQSDAPSLNPYHTQAYTALVQAHQQHPASQGGQAALDRLAGGRFSKADLLATLAKHADNPQALAGIFDALGPQHTLDTFYQVDHHDRDVIGPSGYAPLPERGRGRLWEGNLVEALHRKEHFEQREIFADALSQALTGGLSDAFIQDLANTASTSTQTANQLSQILARSDDTALIPLKQALFNNLMTSEKALKLISDKDPQKQLKITHQRGWVRAATLLLGDNPTAHWLEPMQRAVGSKELSQFIATAVHHTVDKKLDGYSYGDENYQRGLESLLSGLSQLQGKEYTELKAQVFSAASEAMGETHNRKALTEGLKALFVSDPRGIATEIKHNLSNSIQSSTAFSFFFKETIFNNPDPDNKFIEAIASITKELYQNAVDSSLLESESEDSAMTLGLLFGSLRAAFNDAKVENAADQDAVRNMANALTGLATLFPGISVPLSATKDAVFNPVFGGLFNRDHRAQAEKIDLIDDTFNKLIDAMNAGFNGYRKQTGGHTGNFFSIERTTIESDGNNVLGKN
jgi:hypothetical protein